MTRSVKYQNIEFDLPCQLFNFYFCFNQCIVFLDQVKGFDISYLSKVPDVKDTVQKQSLLHHATQCVLEKHPNVSDLYSELGATTRCSRVKILFYFLINFKGRVHGAVLFNARCKEQVFAAKP